MLILVSCDLIKEAENSRYWRCVGTLLLCRNYRGNHTYDIKGVSVLVSRVVVKDAIFAQETVCERMAGTSTTQAVCSGIT